jgi:ankyrin repeat protein
MSKAILSIAMTIAFLLPSTNAFPAAPEEALSDYFFVRHEGRGDDAHIDIFVRAGDDKNNYIGSASTRDLSASGFGGSGEQMSVLAISSDGRSLVFRHYQDFAKRRSRLEGGLYRYEYGKGAKLLHKSDELVEFWKVWKKPPPADMLVFKLRLEKGSSLHGPSMVLTADGEEFPLALLGATALHRAAYEGRAADVDALLDNGVAIDARTYWGDSALDVAMIRGEEDSSLRLVARGANLDGESSPALHRAASQGSFALLEAMIRRGANVTQLDECRNSVLHYAALATSCLPGDYRETVFDGDDRKRPTQDHRLQVVNWVLHHGADVNAVNAQGATALHGVVGSAVNNEDLEIARALLESGANPQLQNHDGNTPLHLLMWDLRTCGGGEGAFSGKPDEWRHSIRYKLLALLVGSMNDLNVRNGHGWTPLELALRNGNELSPQFLIDHGANADLQTESGVTLRQMLGGVISEWSTRCR